MGTPSNRQAPEDEALHQTVAELYRSAIDPSAWKAAFDSLTRLTPVHAAVLAVVEPASGALHLSMVRGYDEAAQQQYAAHYWNLDIGLQALLAWHERTPLLCHEHIAARTVSGNEYYQDFLIPLGGRYGAGCWARLDETRIAQFSLHRSIDQGPFGESERRLLTRLTPHIFNSLRIAETVGGLQRQNALTLASLDALGEAILIVDESGRVQWANRSGDALLQRGTPLAVKNGQLGIEESALDHQLRGCIARACAPRGAGTASLVAIPGSLKHGALQLRVMPLDPRLDIAPSATHRHALLIVRSPFAPPRLETMRPIPYGLTPAEARLACALCEGTTPEEYARRVGVSITTVRAQLRQAFAKTGTRRQTELVALLAPIARG